MSMRWIAVVVVVLAIVAGAAWRWWDPPESPPQWGTYSVSGKRLVTVESDRRLDVWSPDGNARKHVMWAPGPVERVVFSTDDNLIAAICNDGDNRPGVVAAWDVSEFKRTVAKGHPKPVTSVAFSSDGKLMAAGGADGTIRLFSLPDGGEQTILKHNTSPVTSVAFSPEGQMMATGSADGVVRFWDLSTGQSAYDVTVRGPVTQVRFVDEGRWLVACSATADVWRRSDLQHRQLSGEVDRAAISQDGRQLAVARKGEVAVFDLARGQSMFRHKTAGRDEPTALAISPDGWLVAEAYTVDGKGHLRAWHMGGRQLWDKPMPQPVKAVSFSADGRTICVTRDQKEGEGRVHLLDAQDGDDKGALGSVRK